MTAYSPSSRREFLLKGGACLTATGSARRALSQQPARFREVRNVLLVLVPDLRTQLGCFGSAKAKTPHIDRVAETGLTFLRNYCQQAASGPSRTSLLTGLRPDTTRVYDDRVHFRRALPDAVTLPEHFRSHGYATTAFGPVFGTPALEDRRSWSVAPWTPGGPAWGSSEGSDLAESTWRRLVANAWIGDTPSPTSPSQTLPTPPGGSPRSWEATTAADAELPDGRIARAAADAVAELKDQPFLVAVSFERPYFPLVAPEGYFDLYPIGTWDGPESPEPPLDVPAFALHDSHRIRAFDDIPNEGPIPEVKAKELIRAYRACVSFTDAQIGVLLDALDRHGLSKSTVVAVVGVSGSHLGEHGLWNKHSNFDAATHTPLVVRAPGEKNAGRKTDALVESVDLFPSVCSLCQIPRPEALEGSSWRRLFEDPERLWKRAVYSQHPRTIPGVGPGMGHSMRTDRHRYTQWSGIDSPYSTLELYDYKEAPVESRNIANRPEYASLVNGLSHMLREGWQGSLPPTQLPTSSRA